MEKGNPILSHIYRRNSICYVVPFWKRNIYDDLEGKNYREVCKSILHKVTDFDIVQYLTDGTKDGIDYTCMGRVLGMK